MHALTIMACTRDDQTLSHTDAARFLHVTHRYFIFIHFEHFSIWNAPPMRCSRETLRLLQLVFAERLGHVVGWRVPLYFHAFYAALKVRATASTWRGHTSNAARSERAHAPWSPAH